MVPQLCSSWVNAGGGSGGGRTARSPAAEHQQAFRGVQASFMDLLSRFLCSAPCQVQQDPVQSSTYHTYTYTLMLRHIHMCTHVVCSWCQILSSRQGIFINCLFHFSYKSAHPGPPCPCVQLILPWGLQVSLRRESKRTYYVFFTSLHAIPHSHTRFLL